MPRTVLRLVLVLGRGQLLVRPLVNGLDREQLGPGSSPGPAPAPAPTRTLRRSGRSLRRIEASPPTSGRDWQLPASAGGRLQVRSA